MRQASEPIVKDVVLVGGGHSHAIVLKMWRMKPIPGVRLTLITEASETFYAGMLPGHIAGFYTAEECYINLRSLAQLAQAQIFIDQAIALDLNHNQILCAHRPPVPFDLLSINIGSVPAAISVVETDEYAIAVKPIPQFLDRWNQLLAEIAKNQPEKPLRLGIVGGGAAGVELSLAMHSRLTKICQYPPAKLEIHLFQRSSELMSDHNFWVRRCLQQLLTQKGIHLHLGETVREVNRQSIKCESGLGIECDRTFWITQATAPHWLQKSGLKTDANGFIQVSDTLQSISHPHIFAAGDIATMVNHIRPKAGVFAVRQGKPLLENLRRTLLGKPLQPYIPQKQFLSLISTGDGQAIASWGYFGWKSPLLWYWKDRIDRHFINRFRNLQSMSAPQTNSLLASEPAMMRCGGCASKVSSTSLNRVLQRLQLEQSSWPNYQNILIGLENPDDAAVVKVPAGLLMVHTVDYFRSLLNDPFIFGQIIANHCLSDIFAMGATPQSALAIATIPYAQEDKVVETLYQLLAGAIEVLNKSQTPLIGGHTTEGAELAFGLSCNGLVDPNRLLRKGGMKPGQVLILTKALGTGTLFAADMRLQAKGCWIDGAIESMLVSNQAAAACLLQHQASACTDVTGFGLLGHLMEMVQASQVGVELDLAAIPILEGASKTIEMGIFSSLQSQNERSRHYIQNITKMSDRPIYSLLFDPQTAGGLLAAVPEDQLNNCLAALQSQGYFYSCAIGRITPQTENSQPIKLI